MKASRFILTGLALVAGSGLTGCITHPASFAYDAPSDAQVACQTIDYDQAPEIMTYDPYTGKETRVESRSSAAAVMSVRNPADRGYRGDYRRGKAVGVSDGGDRFICRHDKAYGVDLVYGPNPVIVGAVAGAIVGGAATGSGEGAAKGAVVGATLGSSLADPGTSNALSIGAATGALIGSAANGTDGAAVGAVAGGLIGVEAKNKGYTDYRHVHHGHAKDDD